MWHDGCNTPFRDANSTIKRQRVRGRIASPLFNPSLPPPRRVSPPGVFYALRLHRHSMPRSRRKPVSGEFKPEAQRNGTGAIDSRRLPKLESHFYFSSIRTQITLVFPVFLRSRSPFAPRLVPPRTHLATIVHTAATPIPCWVTEAFGKQAPEARFWRGCARCFGRSGAEWGDFARKNDAFVRAKERSWEITVKITFVIIMLVGVVSQVKIPVSIRIILFGVLARHLPGGGCKREWNCNGTQ